MTAAISGSTHSQILGSRGTLVLLRSTPYSSTADAVKCTSVPGLRSALTHGKSPSSMESWSLGSLAVAQLTRSRTCRCTIGSDAQRRQISRIKGVSDDVTATIAPGHCLTMTHRDSKVRCNNSSSASCAKEPKDARTPCSRSNDSRSGASFTAERKRQKARRAQTLTTSGCVGAKADAEACSKAGSSAGANTQTASPNRRSTAKARARRNSGAVASPQRPPAVVRAVGTRGARSPRCKVRGCSSAAAFPKRKSATSASFQALASPASLPRSPRSNSSPATDARARMLSRFWWLRSSPTRLSPERRTAQPRT
mmetsp:Transcript_102565/g.330938  ORF Transcript_102565/g.330938 Transcript_102565/m.330938 type:complete len:311 (-) Transcript_102565:1037-1969(-)